MIIGSARIVLSLGQARSLKDKRAVVRKVIDRTRARFDVAIGEVADLDTWKRATLGISTVGSDGGVVRGVLDEVIRSIEQSYVAPVVSADVHVDVWDDLQSEDFETPAGAGPDAVARDLLAGDDE